MTFLFLTFLFAVIFAILKRTKHPEWDWSYIFLSPIFALIALGLLGILLVVCASLSLWTIVTFLTIAILI